MLGLNPISAVFLVLLWIPVSLHCRLDRGGFFKTAPACCADDAEPAHDPDQCSERCSLLGGGLTKLGNDVLKAPEPVLTTGLEWLVERACKRNVVPKICPQNAASPPGLLRTWQFAARAALQPRAPTQAS